MKKLRAAVVGLGGQSLSDHLPALKAHPDTEVVGVTDVDSQAIARFRTAFPELTSTRTYLNFKQMLDEVQPDFVVVAVPHHLYYEIVKELCARGIPFLKEKPLARNLAEAEQMLSLPNFEQCAFIATQRRFSGLYWAAYQAVGDIGKPYLFNAEYKLSIAEPHTGWRGSRELAGGGCLLDMGYHIVDQLTWWFGMPSEIHANVSTMAVPHTDYTAEDSATVSLRYPNGMHGIMLVSRSAGEKREQYQLYGPEGYIIGSKKGATVHNRGGDIIKRLTPGDENMTEAQLNFFLDRVRGNRAFGDIQTDHLLNMRFIDACYRDACVSA